MRRTLTVMLLVAAFDAAVTAEEERNTRRVVTGFSEEGKAVFAEDVEPAEVIRFDSLPGFEITRLWATPDGPVVPGVGEIPSAGSSPFLPAPGETRLVLVRFPAAEELAVAQEDGSTLEQFAQELEAKVPDLAASHKGDSPSLHATDSIDYIVVVSGEIVLELDDGATTQLSPGDVVIQNGTAHAWHNTGEEPAILAAVLVGARRSD